MSNTEFHVVLGAGQVGTKLAQLLAGRGHRVRMARRSPGPSPVAGVELVTLDVRDADAVARAAEGATAVYHCVNPLYHQWPEMLLPIARGIVDGSARAGARLVVLDNLYVYGDNAHMTEGQTMVPRSKKGALRVRSTEMMLDADARGAVKVSIGRAADFFGPETPLSGLGEPFFKRVLFGKSAQVFGNPDLLHSYSYTPDVAAGLLALGSVDDARGVWMLPVQPAETTRQVVARFARALGHDVPLSRVPTWALRALGIVSPMMRELAEMVYQWEQPYVVDDTKIRTRFGFAPTPWNEAVERTVAWGRAAYAPETAKPSLGGIAA
ncbi:MAG: NAD-dependent epimerase/dehydratase family protein [Myxococcales bacterium]|jgi:nucleoside-diphosphate-sugar epimerase